MTLSGEQVVGWFNVQETEQIKVSRHPGEVIALGRMSGVQSGDLLIASSPGTRSQHWPVPASAVHELVIRAGRSSDEVKLAAAMLHKLLEEDPWLHLPPNEITGELLLEGQGECHPQLLGRIRDVMVSRSSPSVPYQETICCRAEYHARYKRQSGGHEHVGR